MRVFENLPWWFKVDESGKNSKFWQKFNKMLILMSDNCETGKFMSINPAKNDMVMDNHAIDEPWEASNLCHKGVNGKNGKNRGFWLNFSKLEILEGDNYETGSS